LRKLKDLVLRFEDHKVVGYVLSHVWFPESAKVELEAGYDADVCAVLSQVLPCPDMETF
jgi:hypothetical protein